MKKIRVEWKYTVQWKLEALEWGLEVVEWKLEAVGWKLEIGSGRAFWAMVYHNESL